MRSIIALAFVPAILCSQERSVLVAKGATPTATVDVNSIRNTGGLKAPTVTVPEAARATIKTGLELPKNINAPKVTSPSGDDKMKVNVPKVIISPAGDAATNGIVPKVTNFVATLDQKKILANIQQGWKQSIIGKIVPAMQPNVLVNYLGKNKAMISIVITVLREAARNPSMVQQVIDALYQWGVPQFLLYDAIQSISKAAILPGSRSAWKDFLVEFFASLPTAATLPFYSALFRLFVRFPFLRNAQSAIEFHTNPAA